MDIIANDKDPLISIIIPAYNCRETLGTTVESILHSGVMDFEIIIVDDGSTDETPKICNDLCSNYSSIRFIRQKNAGVSCARNRGIREARGEYLLFFDSDDSVEKNAFSSSMSILKELKPEILLFGMSFDYYKNGKCYRRDVMICEQNGLYSREQWVPHSTSLFNCNYISPSWNKFFRKDLIQRHNIRFSEDMHIMEDCLFSMQCLEHSEKVFFLPKAIYRYRQAEDEESGVRRLKNVPSLVDYMHHFDGVLQEWKEIVDSIYFMLLTIKLRNSKIKEIVAIAEEHKSSGYEPHSKSEMWLSTKLLNREYYKLYFHFFKNRFRHKIAVFVKSREIYKKYCYVIRNNEKKTNACIK